MRLSSKKPSGANQTNDKAMQNLKTLTDLGFKRHKKWDGEVTESYMKEHNGKIFSAHECGSSMGFPDEKTFISIGEVIKEEVGIVKYWADCCSDGSVERFINKDAAFSGVACSQPITT